MDRPHYNRWSLDVLLDSIKYLKIHRRYTSYSSVEVLVQLAMKSQALAIQSQGGSHSRCAGD